LVGERALLKPVQGIEEIVLLVAPVAFERFEDGQVEFILLPS
jgi:hypothetical protein